MPARTRARRVRTCDSGGRSSVCGRPDAYRGYHCAVCRVQLRDLDRCIDDFASRGVEIVAVSADDRQRAERSQVEWPVEHVPLGFGLGIVNGFCFPPRARYRRKRVVSSATVLTTPDTARERQRPVDSGTHESPGPIVPRRRGAAWR